MTGVTASAKPRAATTSFITVSNAVISTPVFTEAKNAIAPSAAFVMVAYNSDNLLAQSLLI